MNDSIGDRYPRLSALEARLDYVFADPNLLIRAMTHSSYGDGQRITPDNERLEFLGDRVLGLLTASALYHYSQESEGTLARRLNALENLRKIRRPNFKSARWLEVTGYQITKLSSEAVLTIDRSL